MNAPSRHYAALLLQLLLVLLLVLVEMPPCRGDEEDPLQHVAQVAARNRQLSDVLELLRMRQSLIPDDENPSDGEDNQEEEEEEEEDNEPVEALACQHEELNLDTTLEGLQQFREGRMAALHMANLLNNLFIDRSRLPTSNLVTGRGVLAAAATTESSDAADTLPQYEWQVFYALVRAALVAEPSILGLGVAFKRSEVISVTPSVTPPELFAAYGFRRGGSSSGAVRVANLAALYNMSYDDPNTLGTSWFTRIAHSLRPRRVNVTNGDSSAAWALTLTKGSDGRWAPQPYLDCGASSQWVAAYSLPFFARARKGSVATFRGVVLVTFPLERVDINQCDDPDEGPPNLFGGTHRCHAASTQCVAVPGMGLRRGGYQCVCRRTHYLPHAKRQFYNGSVIEHTLLNTNTSHLQQHAFRCLPCPEGCEECREEGLVCVARYNAVSRLVPVLVQAVCVLACLALSVIVFKLRKCKVVGASLWTMLEVILLGSIILYCTVFLQYLEPSVVLCMALPWFRELGFALFYGSIVLKLYRSLVDHRTRKAHRYVIRDRDLLKYLGGLVVFVAGYLAAWAALTAHLATEGHSPLTVGHTPEGLAFNVCQSLWWEYVTEAGEQGGELLFVLFGLYLAWQLHRAVGTNEDLHESRERRALATALVLEGATSSLLYAARHVVWLSAHPDVLFLASFARTHLTVSLSLLLIFMPKLVCVVGGAGRDVPRRTYSATEGPQELRFCEPLTNGDLEPADLNLAQMDPEEIRAELKRVYTQLEVLRNKTMRKDNPHISKRRGGRKATHRRFSIQSLHRQHQNQHRSLVSHAIEGEVEVSKTPEESVCSLEGPSVLSVYADGPSTYSEMGTPSILHRSYKL
ncbi:G-protein coupled receptor 158 smog isoform X3 [Oratosquilla oratoria]|uniref:G-protein coupled receptor 158 smog isoform X3 n=1 Tax=Oratosquilla oratoria TaxID=337810 RepID=UPI003F761C98